MENVAVVVHHKYHLDPHISSFCVFIRPLNQATFLMRHHNWSTDEVLWWLTKDGGHYITCGKQYEGAVQCHFLMDSSVLKLEFSEKKLSIYFGEEILYIWMPVPHTSGLVGIKNCIVLLGCMGLSMWSLWRGLLIGASIVHFRKFNRIK